MDAHFKEFTDFSNTKISFFRDLADYSKIRLFWGLLIRNNRYQLRGLNLKDKNYLNVGCGDKINRDFINLDYFWCPGIDLCWDIMKGIPLPDASMLGVFAEHLLEHFSPDDGKRALRELRRVMRKGGIIRIVVPDGALYMDLYCEGRKGKKVTFPYSKEGGDETPMMCVNNLFYRHGHKCVYDFETLSKILREIGFKSKESFGHGRNSKLLLDQEIRRCESLYVEAVA